MDNSFYKQRRLKYYYYFFIFIVSLIIFCFNPSRLFQAPIVNRIQGQEKNTNTNDPEKKKIQYKNTENALL